MLWHCGLLDPQWGPQETLENFRRYDWFALPAPLAKELRIWLAMPGFSISYHSETLKKSRPRIRQFMGGYEALKADVVDNWLSADRDDCLRLAYLRPKNGAIPLLVKLQMRRDYARGVPQNQIAEEYYVRPSTVNKLCWGVPEEVDALPSELFDILRDDPRISGEMTPSKVPQLGRAKFGKTAFAHRQHRKQVIAALNLPPISERIHPICHLL